MQAYTCGNIQVMIVAVYSMKMCVAHISVKAIQNHTDARVSDSCAVEHITHTHTTLVHSVRSGILAIPLRLDSTPSGCVYRKILVYLAQIRLNTYDVHRACPVQRCPHSASHIAQHTLMCPYIICSSIPYIERKRDRNDNANARMKREVCCCCCCSNCGRESAYYFCTGSSSGRPDAATKR